MQDVYAKKLEEELNQTSSTSFEVVMLSLGALNTAQEAHLLEVEGLKYDPNLVLVGYVLNDAQDRNPELRKPKELSRGEKIRRVLKRSSLITHTWMLLKKVAWQTLDVSLRIKTENDDISSDFYSELRNDTDKWRKVIDAFGKISKISQERDIPAVIVIFPILHKFDDYPWLHVHSIIIEGAASQGLSVLDLLPTFEGTTDEEVRIGAGDYVHPNAYGHKLAGDAIYGFLRDEKLLCANGNCDNGEQAQISNLTGED